MKSVWVLILTVTLLHFGRVAAGQTYLQENMRLVDFLKDKIDYTELKDSTAIYSFNIKVSVRNGGDEVKQVEFSDTTESALRALSAIRSFDFKPLLEGRQSAEFIVPIAVIVVGSKPNNHKIDAHIISEKIHKLYYTKDAADSIFERVILSPLIVTVDKKVYD